MLDVETAISGYTEDLPELITGHRPGPWITLGGGNAAGIFTVEKIDQVKQDLSKVIDAKYSGIVFDVEYAEGDEKGLISSFQSVFKECKKLNLEVIVTMSHSAPC